jgi:thiamine-phosphate pyrophosphorylase
MDARLIRDARAVKRRLRLKHPVLWLFTDATRLPDPLPAIAKLPRCISGVVFRHDGTADRLILGKAIARLCRTRRIPLVVAGDARLAAALRAGQHLRGGQNPLISSRRHPVTASAHNFTELQQAARAGADLVFLSPAFATATHPQTRPLGAMRWTKCAKFSGIPVLALGGMAGSALRSLGRHCAGAGAIGALTAA